LLNTSELNINAIARVATARLPGPDRRQRDDDPDERGAGHGGHHGGLEGPAVGRHQPGCHPGPDTGEGELAQRELAGVPRHDDDRGDDDGEGEGGDECVGPRVDAGEEAGADGDPDDEREQRHPSRAGQRQAGRGLAPLEAGAAGQDHVGEDDRQRHGLDETGQRGRADVEPVGEVGLEQEDLALHDADQECGADGDPEGGEPTHQGGGQRGQDGDGEHGRVERDDRGEEDGRERGQAAGDREVGQLDAVRCPARAGRHPPVLGDGRGGQAEQRPGVDDSQHRGAGEGDPDQQQTVLADAEVAPQGHVVGRQQRLGLHHPRPPAQDHERLSGAEEAEGGDELGQPRGVAEQ
jgi:hypothetical protein